MLRTLKQVLAGIVVVVAAPIIIAVAGMLLFWLGRDREAITVSHIDNDLLADDPGVDVDEVTE